MRADLERWWRDNVPRKRVFLAHHPDWTVVHVGPGKYTWLGHWQAIRTEPDGETIVTRDELGTLLDIVEAIAGKPQRTCECLHSGGCITCGCTCSADGNTCPCCQVTDKEQTRE